MPVTLFDILFITALLVIYIGALALVFSSYMEKMSDKLDKIIENQGEESETNG